MEKLLEGKVAVITGGSRGIGKAICLSLAREGADVNIIYSSEADSNFPAAIKDTLAEILGYSSASAYDCNLACLEKAYKTIDAIVSSKKKIDILINNAAVSPFISLDETAPELWDEIFSVNLRTPFFISKQVAGIMENNAVDEFGYKGAIINLSSISAGRGGNSHPYCAAKSGIESITKTLALELSKNKIRVNAISPGMIDTDLNRGGLKYYNKEQVNALYASIPLGRPGLPEEIGPTAVFLSSNKLSSYITGAVIPVTSGWDVMIAGEKN